MANNNIIDVTNLCIDNEICAKGSFIIGETVTYTEPEPEQSIIKPSINATDEVKRNYLLSGMYTFKKDDGTVIFSIKGEDLWDKLRTKGANKTEIRGELINLAKSVVVFTSDNLGGRKLRSKRSRKTRRSKKSTKKSKRKGARKSRKH